MNTPRPAARRGWGWYLLIGSGAGALMLMLLLAAALIAIGLFSGAPLASSHPVDLDRLGADGPGDDFSAPAASRYIELTDGTRIDESQVAHALRRAGQDETWASFSWMYGGRTVTTIAPGLDRRHHFANSFLVGHVPYPDVASWVPLYALARRKNYQFDHDQYAGAEEIWQTSREAFHYRDGDCEDHALALADWLIGLGHDARVVIGQVEGGGHAWVVLIDGDRTYLLEATDKRQGGEQALPLAASMPEYLPEAMFDRERYWVNSGPTRTSDYTGAQWRLVSRFTRAGDAELRREPAAEPEADDAPREKRIRRR